MNTMFVLKCQHYNKYEKLKCIDFPFSKIENGNFLRNYYLINYYFAGVKVNPGLQSDNL